MDGVERSMAGQVGRVLLWPLRMALGWHFPDYFRFADCLKVMTVGIEPDLKRFCAGAIREGETVLDVGANVGFTARLFSRRVGRQGHVHAFEPETSNLTALRHNLSRYPQATVHDCAIGDQDGTATLFLNCTSGTGNSLMPHALGTRQMTVACMTLDSFLATHPEIRPDWVKVDVEGGEFRVLAGMRASVAKFPGMRLLIELCPQNLGGQEAAERLVSLVRELGFGVFVIGRDGEVVPFAGVEAHRSELEPLGYVNLYGVRTGHE